MTEAEILGLWEAGRMLHPLDRGLLAARAGSPPGPGGNAADWPLGRRNRALAQLHCAVFGGMLRGWARCPTCGEQLEFDFDSQKLIEAASDLEDRLVTVGEWSFRLPTSRDLAAASAEASEAAAALRLLSNCWAGAQPPHTTWNDDDVRRIEESMAEADPLAEIRLHFDCPDCTAAFDESLDLPSFVWAEIDSQARAILTEVHELATAYGWSESTVLALSPARRGAYLELVRA
jgi:hypothetical protein